MKCSIIVNLSTYRINCNFSMLLLSNAVYSTRLEFVHIGVHSLDWNSSLLLRLSSCRISDIKLLRHGRCYWHWSNCNWLTICVAAIKLATAQTTVDYWGKRVTVPMYSIAFYTVQTALPFHTIVDIIEESSLSSDFSLHRLSLYIQQLINVSFALRWARQSCQKMLRASYILDPAKLTGMT